MRTFLGFKIYIRYLAKRKLVKKKHLKIKYSSQTKKEFLDSMYLLPNIYFNSCLANRIIVSTVWKTKFATICNSEERENQCAFFVTIAPIGAIEECTFPAFLKEIMTKKPTDGQEG